MARIQNAYASIVEYIFSQHYKPEITDFLFDREELLSAAKALNIKLPKNPGDLIYSFRYRTSLPDSIKKTAPNGFEWVIRPYGKGKYQFSLSNMPRIIPSSIYAEIKILDSTPGIIDKYALNDEQGLLAKVRYNRLIDIFTGITCYSLQNHLRTTVPNIGQIETDELYVGVDKKGCHYIFPVQAKGGTDQLGIVQVEQDFAMCSIKFPNLICIPIAAQFITSDSIALFSFINADNTIKINSERHYKLVTSKALSDEELKTYKDTID